MKKEEFFTVDNTTQGAEGDWTFQVSLNSDCEVYKGHFPGQPIAPGVCLLTMISECAKVQMQQNEKKLRLGNIKRCKLMHPVIPGAVKNMEIKVIPDHETLSFDAVLYDSEYQYVTINATLVATE